MNEEHRPPPAVQAALGTPIAEDLFVTCSIIASAGSGG